MPSARVRMGAALGLSAWALVACWGPQSPSPTPTRRPQARAATAPSLGAPLAGQVLLPASVAAAKAGLFQAQGGGLLSNHGGGLVGDVGGGILSNNGSSWRLLQQAEALPLVSAAVQLLAASGQPLLGPDGQPLRATTDAEGRFRFPASPKGQAYLVAVALPPSVGPMVALVPKARSEAPIALVVDQGSTALVAHLLEDVLPGGAGAQAGLDAISVGQAEAYQDAVSVALKQQAPLAGFLKADLLPKLEAAGREAAVASAAEALKGAVQGAVAAATLAPSPGPAPATPSASRAPTPTPVPSGSPWPREDNVLVLVAFRWPQGQGLALAQNLRAERAQVSAEGYQPMNTDSTPYEVDADRLGFRVWVPFPRSFSGSIPYRLNLGPKDDLRFTLPSVVMQVGTLKSDAVTQPAGVSFSATARHQVQVQVQSAVVANGVSPLAGVVVTLQNALMAGTDGTPVPAATTNAQGQASFGPLLLPLSFSYSLRQGARTTGSAFSCNRLTCSEEREASSINAKARFTVTAWPQASADANASGGAKP